jgi:hypothetical protein
MTELLAIPGWKTSPTTLDAWIRGFVMEGLDARAVREAPNASWIEVPSIGLRGYAIMREAIVEAINFELDGQGAPLLQERLARVAEGLGWELHEDDGDPEDDAEEAD